MEQKPEDIALPFLDSKRQYRVTATHHFICPLTEEESCVVGVPAASCPQGPGSLLQSWKKKSSSTCRFQQIITAMAQTRAGPITSDHTGKTFLAFL